MDQKTRNLLEMATKNSPHKAYFNFHPVSMDADSMKPVIEALCQRENLLLVDFSRSKIADAGAVVIAELIATSTSLEELRLGYDSISDLGAVAIADGLAKNQKLRKLLLPGNSIGDEGALAIANAIGKHHGLRILDVAGNPIQAAGTLALAALERICPGLMVCGLDLSPQNLAAARASLGFENYSASSFVDRISKVPSTPFKD